MRTMYLEKLIKIMSEYPLMIIIVHLKAITDDESYRP